MGDEAVTVVSVDPGQANFGLVAAELKNGAARVFVAESGRVCWQADSWGQKTHCVHAWLQKRFAKDWERAPIRFMVCEDNVMGVRQSIPANVFVQASAAMFFKSQYGAETSFMRPFDKWACAPDDLWEKKTDKDWFNLKGKNKSKKKSFYLAKYLVEQGVISPEEPLTKGRLLANDHICDALCQLVSHAVKLELLVVDPERRPKKRPKPSSA